MPLLETTSIEAANVANPRLQRPPLRAAPEPPSR